MNTQDIIAIIQSLSKIACTVLMFLNIAFGLFSMLFDLYNVAYYFFAMACFMGAAVWFLEFVRPAYENE